MRILVVGAGPTGLTMALAARQRGIEVRLIDKAPAPSSQSKALGVQARTLEVMERLGTLDAVRRACLAIEGVTWHLGTDEVGIDFVNPQGLPSLVVLPQAETEHILGEAGALAERGVELLGLGAEGATLRRPDGGTETVAADWIIGCDGAHSTVRHALGIAFEGAAYAENLVLADGRLEGLAAARVHAFPAGEATVAFLPLPNGLWRAIRVLPADVPAPEEPTAAPFAVPGTRFDGLVWYSRFKISRRQATSLRVGRAVLVGDAAHIHSPVGGQGMNLGIQDAFSLAAALPQGEAAVDRWAAERHAVAARVLRATDRLTRTMFSPGPVAGLARQVAPRLLELVSPLAHRAERALAGLDYPELPP